MRRRSRNRCYDRRNTHSYNGLGDRVRVVKPTGTRHFVYDTQGRMIAPNSGIASFLAPDRSKLTVPVSPVWAAAIGAIWPPMRVLYALGYHKAAEKRLIPLYISMPPIYIFVLGSLIGGIVRLVSGE
jgi:hypothetical protein